MPYLVIKDGVLQVNGSNVLKSTAAATPSDNCCCAAVECPVCNDNWPAELIAEFDGFTTPGCCSGMDLNADSFSLVKRDACCLRFTFGQTGADHYCEEITFGWISLCFFADYMQFQVYSETAGALITWRSPYPDPENIDCTVDWQFGDWSLVEEPFDGPCGFNSGVTFTLSLPA